VPKHQYLPIYLILVLLPVSYFLGYTPLLISFIFLIFSVLAYLAYAKDKSAARKGEWRVSENTLHILSLLCGWPGAIIAQEKLRHKTKKVSFRIVFWLTLLVNLGVLSWLHTQDGSKLMHGYIYKFEHLVVGEFGASNTSIALLSLTKFRGE